MLCHSLTTAAEVAETVSAFVHLPSSVSKLLEQCECVSVGCSAL